MTEDDPIAAPANAGAASTASETRGQAMAGRVAIGLLGLAGLYTLRRFLPALGWAVIFAISLWPWFEHSCQRWPHGRKAVLPAAFTLLILLVFIIPLVMVTTAVLHDGVAVLHWLAEARAQGLPPPPFLKQLPFAAQITNWWQTTLSLPGGINHLSLHAGPAGPSQFTMGERILGGLLHRLLLIGFMLLTLFFLLREGEKLVVALRIASSRAFGEAGERVADQAVQAVRGTVNGLVIVGFGESLLLGVTYALAGVIHAALFGILTGLLSAIPFGAMVAVLVAAGILAAGGQVTAAAIVVAIGAIVVFVADHFVRPVFIGGATRLPFLWVLLGILGGVETWGLIGLVLGPALIAVLMLLWREWVGETAGPLNAAPGEAEMGKNA